MKQFIAVIGAVLVGIGLFVGGFFTGQRNGQAMSPGGMMGAGNGQSGSAMMSGQNGADMTEAGPYGSDMMGAGMMGDQYGAGMMVSLGGLNNVDPLSIEAAEAAVTDYISSLDQDNLALGEIMIFANHAYAQVIDQTTATGAFEVLIDPVSRTVFPEPGPNMMWNTEYGMMSGGSSGMMGGMMNGQYGSGMMSGSQYGSAMMNEGQYGGMMGSLGYVPDAEISFTAPEISGVVPWSNAAKRIFALAPFEIRSRSRGATRASSVSGSSSGTISMIGSPAATTPPTVCTAS